MEYKINFPKHKQIIEVKLINRQLRFYDHSAVRSRCYICDLTNENIKTNIKVDNKVESFIKILDSENIKFEWDENFNIVLKYISGSLIMWVTFVDRLNKKLYNIIDDIKLENENSKLEIQMLKTNITELKILIDKISFERNVFKTKSVFLQEDIDILNHKHSISEI
jgi:hypothetical protein